MILTPAWLRDADLVRLADVFARHGLFFVGGCVRDTLMERAVGDVDAATPLPPDEVQALLAQANISTVPTGLAHGTITALLPREGQKNRPVEITTFRRDVETDGRHAKVAYRATMEEDAARRDFTMNALYLSPEGTLFDPTGQGIADAMVRCLRFVGDPARRIAEDALRLLRFWRFAAQLELPEDDWDEHSRHACADAVEALDSLSGERIQAEMRKLICASAPGQVLDAMRVDGAIAHLIPGMESNGAIDSATKWETGLGLPPQFAVRLAYLISSGADPHWMAERWKLSNADRTRLLWLIESPTQSTVAELQAVMRIRGREDGLCLALWQALWGRGLPSEVLALREWEIPVFPIKGNDLQAAGYGSGKEMGNILRKLEAAWEESGYTLSKQELLSRA